MLPDFAKARALTKEILETRLQLRTMASMGILGQIRGIVLHEGDRMELHRFDGSVDEKQLEGIRSELKITLDDLKERGISAVFDAVDRAAQDIADKQKQMIFKRVDEITAETGQRFDAGGRPLTFEIFMQALSGIEIDFDQAGQPVLPTLFGPKQFARHLQDWSQSDEKKDRFNELIEKKRLEWRDRESRRRLVD